MQAYYGVDLSREIGHMSWRRLQVLVEGLPEGAAVRRQTAAGSGEPDEEAARRLFEAVSAFGGGSHAGS